MYVKKMDYNILKFIFCIFIFLDIGTCVIAQCGSSCKEGCDQFTRACVECENNLYGRHCENDCSGNCQNHCDRYTGNCDSCVSGHYASWCLESCSSGCASDCDMDSGNCVTCKTAWYGVWCNEPCPQNCKGGCNRITGDCLECEVGFYGRHCNVECLESCSVGCDQFYGTCNYCNIGSYGVSCDKACPSNCKGYKCLAPNGYCIDCNIGYYGQNCNSTCPANCKGSCNFVSGNCFSCEDGFFGDKCKSKCSMNCVGPCSQTGECFSCISGYHGNQCTSSCPEHCVSSCKQDTGECYTCVDGTWGKHCNLSCGQNCLGPCHQDIGACKMCLDGWHGTTCNDQCPSNCQSSLCTQTGLCNDCETGYFGYHCDQKCLSCKNNTCFQNNGTCVFGCSDEFYGTHCDMTCADDPTCVSSPTANVSIDTTPIATVTHTRTSVKTTTNITQADVITSSTKDKTTQRTSTLTTTATGKHPDKDKDSDVIVIVIIITSIVVAAGFVLIAYLRYRRKSGKNEEDTYDEIGYVKEDVINPSNALPDYTVPLQNRATHIYDQINHANESRSVVVEVDIQTAVKELVSDNDGYEVPVTNDEIGLNEISSSELFDNPRVMPRNHGESMFNRQISATSANAFITNPTSVGMMNNSTEENPEETIVMNKPSTLTLTLHDWNDVAINDDAERPDVQHSKAQETNYCRSSSTSAYAEIVNATQKESTELIQSNESTTPSDLNIREFGNANSNFERNAELSDNPTDMLCNHGEDIDNRSASATSAYAFITNPTSVEMINNSTEANPEETVKKTSTLYDWNDVAIADDCERIEMQYSKSQEPNDGRSSNNSAYAEIVNVTPEKSTIGVDKPTQLNESVTPNHLNMPESDNTNSNFERNVGRVSDGSAYAYITDSTGASRN